MGNPEGSPAWQEKQTKALQAAKDHVEEFRDPSTLSDDYLSGVQDRIFKGTASGQDYLYQNEVVNRFQLSDKAKEFFKKR